VNPYRISPYYHCPPMVFWFRRVELQHESKNVWHQLLSDTARIIRELEAASESRSTYTPRGGLYLQPPELGR